MAKRLSKLDIFSDDGIKLTEINCWIEENLFSDLKLDVTFENNSTATAEKIPYQEKSQIEQLDERYEKKLADIVSHRKE